MMRKTLEKFEKMNIIDLYVNQNYSLNSLQSLIGSDKRTIRDYLLANNIEVKGIKNPEIKQDISKLVLNKGEKELNCFKFDSIDSEEKAY